MEKLQKLTEGEHTPLMRILFGQDSPTLVPSKLQDENSEAGKVEFFDPNLNDSQRDAIRFALASREIALIHGPPGVCCSCPMTIDIGS